MVSLLALFLCAATPRAVAQASADPPRTYKSVYGKLESVDPSLKGVVMRSDAGERLAWRFDTAVIAEAARFKPGANMIVIYRQLSSNEKRVTALAFPGTATSGGLAEVTEPCWCCAPAGETCTPGNESGQGRALLVGCFK